MSTKKLIIDPNFDSKKLTNYQCFVHINNCSISYKICDDKNSKTLLFEHQKFPTQMLLNPEKLEQCLVKCEVEIRRCKSWKITIQNENFSIIPTALFSEETIVEQIQINSGESQNQSFYFSSIEQLNINFAFSINNKLASYFENNFPNAQITHTGLNIIENTYNDFNTLEEGQLFTHVQDNYLSICCFSENGLRFFNQFYISNAEDFIYYLLFVCEQLKIKTANSKLVLLGEIILGEKMHHYAYNYFSKIQFGENKSKSELNQVYSELPSHTFYTLFKDRL